MCSALHTPPTGPSHSVASSPGRLRLEGRPRPSERRQLVGKGFGASLALARLSIDVASSSGWAPLRARLPYRKSGTRVVRHGARPVGGAALASTTKGRQTQRRQKSNSMGPKSMQRATPRLVQFVHAVQRARRMGLPPSPKCPACFLSSRSSAQLLQATSACWPTANGGVRGSIPLFRSAAVQLSPGSPGMSGV